MKVAIFEGYDEVIILAVKGGAKDETAIDGFNQWFGPDSDRDVNEYSVNMGHIGATEGIILKPEVKISITGNETNIEHWVHCEEDEDERGR